MRREGFSLVLMMFVFIALSGLLLQLYTRSSYLLLTIVERERIVQLKYSTHALVSYMAQLVKHNWRHIEREEPVILRSFPWYINEDKQGIGFCTLKRENESVISITTKLCYEKSVYGLYCEVIRVKQGQNVIGNFVIRNWHII